MQRNLDDIGKLVLRLTLGILVLLHGVAKLANGVGGIEDMVTAMGMPGFVAYGVYAGEVLGPLLLIVGFHARIGATLIALNMVVAIVLVHTHELMMLTKTGGWALELQGMFLFTSIALLFMGPGRISVNQR